jgi:hypothetical protein
MVRRWTGAGIGRIDLLMNTSRQPKRAPIHLLVWLVARIYARPAH